MPEQGTQRALPITSAPFEAPFTTETQRLGTGGLDLVSAADAAKESDLRRLTNLIHREHGVLEVRPGLVDLTGAVGTIHHSAIRFQDPQDSDYTRVYGIDTSLYRGQGAPVAIESGFSGDPLTFVPYRPPLSGDPWLFVADRDQCRKVRFDGLVLPVGLPPPAASIVVAAEARQSTPIMAFDSSDGSDAATWIGNAGFDYQRADDQPPPQPTGVPIATDGGGVDGNTVELKTVPGATVLTAGRGYYSFWSHPLTKNLNVVGALAASDDDLLHTWVKFSHPDLTDEFRVYFVCSPAFDTSVIPGTSTTGANGDFYVKTWRANDFSNFLATQISQISAAETARIRAIRDADLKARKIEDERAAWEQQRAAVDPARVRSFQTGAGREQWMEYGVLGVPVRRGDFMRVGITAGCDWSTITGIVILIKTADHVGGEIAVSLDDMYLYGGRGPDSCEPGAQQYDWRYTHYDPRTGAEGNPSPTQPDAAKIDLLRQAATLHPEAYGDSAVRQRFYRRGGSLFDDWYFLGENTADGADFFDTIDDADASAAGTVDIDNDQLVTSVNDAGDAVRAVPLPALWGPIEDCLLGCGDPYRPGEVYWSKPGQPDAWPPDFHREVCPPSEPLMNGGLYAGQSFVFSQERLYLLYPNLGGTSTTFTAAPSQCQKGLANRWAYAVTPTGICFVSDDGVYRTRYGPAELLSEAIRPLFKGVVTEGYQPIDLTATTKLRLEFHDSELWFTYQDALGSPQTFILNLLTEEWRAYSFEQAVGFAKSEDGSTTLLLGGAGGHTYTHSGTDDSGSTFTWRIRTRDHDLGRPREEKLLGDLYLDAAPNGTQIQVITRLNSGDVINPILTVDGDSRNRYILTPFGNATSGRAPQKARTLSVEVIGVSAATPPVLYQMGVAYSPQPDLTTERVTQWDDLGHPDEKYLTGLVLDVDTGNAVRTILVEYDDPADHQTKVAATLTVQSDGRHKLSFSWPAVKAQLVRLRPDDDCLFWLLYRVDWIRDPEPPRIAGWDINHENPWDSYITGFDLECNTFGAAKVVELYVDQALVQTYTVAALGRRVVHLTVQPPIRGHVLRFVAIDAAPGLLYSHRWHLDAEPSEQTNWNQNYTVAGALGDKFLKGLLLECDTFGQQKNVTVEIDGGVVETLGVTQLGRGVQEFSFPQHLGRLFRLLPVDGYPGRLYSLQWIFDQEPLKLLRWESQEITYGIEDLWKLPLYMHVVLKSTKPVTLTMTVQTTERGDTVRYQYELPSTNGEKRMLFLPFERMKGVLFKHVLTSSEAFFLYREETTLVVRSWPGDRELIAKPFGNDDNTVPTRSMISSEGAASRSGGGSS